jgi:hypothetical protein
MKEPQSPLIHWWQAGVNVWLSFPLSWLSSRFTNSEHSRENAHLDFTDISFYTQSMSIHPMSKNGLDKNRASSSQQRCLLVDIFSAHRKMLSVFSPRFMDIVCKPLNCLSRPAYLQQDATACKDILFLY